MNINTLSHLAETARAFVQDAATRRIDQIGWRKLGECLGEKDLEVVRQALTAGRPQAEDLFGPMGAIAAALCDSLSYREVRTEYEAVELVLIAVSPDPLSAAQAVLMKTKPGDEREEALNAFEAFMATRGIAISTWSAKETERAARKGRARYPWAKGQGGEKRVVDFDELEELYEL